MNRTFLVIQWVGNPDEQQIKNRLHTIGGEIEQLEEISSNYSIRKYEIQLQNKIKELQDKLHRRNMQIKELRKALKELSDLTNSMPKQKYPLENRIIQKTGQALKTLANNR